MLDLNRLIVFRAVATIGSISEAADSLGYTKSAVSQQISALQRETGLELFARSGRGLALTSHGRALLAESDTLVLEHAALTDFVEGLTLGRHSPLTIGTFASVGESWLPGVLADMRLEHPETPINVALTDPAAATKRPDIDIRVEMLSDPPQAPRGYTRRALGIEPYVAVLPAGHRLCGNAGDSGRGAPLRLLDLADEMWIRDDVAESHCSVIVADAWRAAGHCPTSAIQAADHHGALAFVRAGLGITIMPRLPARIAEETEGIEVRELESPTPMRRIVLHIHDSIAHHPVVPDIVAALDAAARSDEHFLPAGSAKDVRESRQTGA